MGHCAYQLERKLHVNIEEVTGREREREKEKKTHQKGGTPWFHGTNMTHGFTRRCGE
jgi:hypothetical protein